MAQLLGEPKTGLAALLEQEGGVLLDKRHQRADWGRRPLTRSQVNYAAADTAFLARLARCLRERLDGLDRWEWAVDEFHRLEEVRHQPAEPDPLAFERVKGVRALRGRARDLAFTLFEWREGEAQRLDVPPFKVLGAKPLLALAESPPKKKKLLTKVEGIGPRFVRRWGDQVMAVIARPDRAPKRGRKKREPDLPAAVTRRAKRLAAARDQVVETLGLDSGLVCPRACVLAVAALDPRGSGLGDLESAGLTGWRLEILGEAFLEVMAGSSTPTRRR